MTYKFYIRLDGEIFGPYSAKGMNELDLLPDIMVTEINMNEWQPAENFDFADLAKQEMIEKLKSTQINEDNQEADDAETKKHEFKARLIYMSNSTASKVNEEIIRPPVMKFPNSIEYKANFNEGLNAIGGKLIITPTHMIFRAHCLNFGNLNDRVFEISQISGYEKGFLTYFYISFLNGSKIKLNVWNKDGIIEQLEARRISLLNGE